MANTEHPNIAAVLAGPVLDLLPDTWVQLAIPYSQTGHYVRGLFEAESVEYSFEGNELAVSLRNAVGYAAAVEFGHEAFHLPSKIHNCPHYTKKMYRLHARSVSTSHAKHGRKRKGEGLA